MKNPEWRSELLRIGRNLLVGAANDLNEHKNEENIHRAIHVSTVSPTNTEGADGDIWITYEP